MRVDTRGVFAAFEILLEEIEMVVGETAKVGAKQFEAQDFNEARNTLVRAEMLTAFRQKVLALKEEAALTLPQLLPSSNEVGTDTQVESRGYTKLKKGLRTPQEAYYEPIVAALKALGGSAPMNEVLQRVEKTMKGVLKDVDYEPLNSDPASIRWRNSAQWARNTLVKNGVLKDNSPRGIWELTESSR